MADSIFMQIISGEVPSHKIYEDDKTLAFLDINPVQPGHTLVIPKKPITYLWDLDDEDYMAVMHTAKLVGTKLRQTMDAEHVGVKVEGLDVPHTHVHLIPFSTPEEFRYIPDHRNAPDHEALMAIAQKLAF
ncbi:MAG: HIT family protein [Patescibacteria group bacterium]|nr:HIT family protein [Patescibacteria group bacterium]